MTCDHVRTALRTESIEAWASLEPHLDHCSECTALAAELRERSAELQAELDDFAQAPSFDAAFAGATEQLTASKPAHGARTMFDSVVHISIIAAAAAAAIGLGFYSTTTGPAGDPDPIEAATTARCGDRPTLESQAMIGALSADAVACLEKRVAEEGDANTLRLLVVDAFSRNDVPLWEGRAEALALLTPDDPDLHYKLALHLSKGGAETAERTIAHAEAAQRHSGVWTGETGPKRVGTLFKLRTVAAMDLWKAAPEDPKGRVRAGTFAKEWLEHTRSADLDSTTAAQVCEVATGAPCEG